MKKVLSVRKLTIIGVLSSISIVLGLMPGIGFIPIGPTRATIMHIPVIIGGILEGPVVGGFIGLLFGFFSIYQSIVMPTPVSFVFRNPLIAIGPRVLIGLVSHYSYRLIRKIGVRASKTLIGGLSLAGLAYLLYGAYKALEEGIILNLVFNILLIILLVYLYNKGRNKEDSLDIVLSSILGTLTNTFGVLFLIYFIYGERFVTAMGMDPAFGKKIIMGIGVSNGIPETIISVIITTTVVSAIRKEK